LVWRFHRKPVCGQMSYAHQIKQYCTVTIFPMAVSAIALAFHAVRGMYLRGGRLLMKARSCASGAEDWGSPLRRAIGAERLSEACLPYSCASAHKN